MRDTDVRNSLLSHLVRRYKNPDSCAVTEELDVWHGTTRIDVAVINGSVNGYEIKSERDSLSRLEFQSYVYNLAFDKVTLIAAKKHLEKASRIVPEWWGLKEPVQHKYGVKISPIRRAQPNPGSNLEVFLCFLNKSECLSILEQRNLARGFKSAKLNTIHRHMIEKISETDLRRDVREAMRRKMHSRNLLAG